MLPLNHRFFRHLFFFLFFSLFVFRWWMFGTSLRSNNRSNSFGWIMDSYRSDVPRASKGGDSLVKMFLEHAIPMAIVAQRTTVTLGTLSSSFLRRTEVPIERGSREQTRNLFATTVVIAVRYNTLSSDSILLRIISSSFRNLVSQG